MITENELREIKKFFLKNRGSYEGTIRGVAKQFGLSKSGVHSLLHSYRMKKIASNEEWQQIQKQLKENRKMCGKRGGKAVQEKWAKVKGSR